MEVRIGMYVPMHIPQTLWCIEITRLRDAILHGIDSYIDWLRYRPLKIKTNGRTGQSLSSSLPISFSPPRGYVIHKTSEWTDLSPVSVADAWSGTCSLTRSSFLDAGLVPRIGKSKRVLRLPEKRVLSDIFSFPAPGFVGLLLLGFSGLLLLGFAVGPQFFSPCPNFWRSRTKRPWWGGKEEFTSAIIFCFVLLRENLTNMHKLINQY